MTSDEFIAWLHRQDKPETKALEQRYYGDPADIVEFQKRGAGMDEQLKTKDIERELHNELENWLRWGKRRDWMPVSFRCPLGFLYKSTDTSAAPIYRAQPCDELEAVKLERIVVSLPQKHRQAFVMHQMDKAEINGMIRIVTGRDDKARLLGVSNVHYHRLVRQSLNMIVRELGRILKKAP